MAAEGTRYTLSSTLRLIPLGLWIFAATLVVCATTLTIFYFVSIRTAPVLRTRAACEQAGEVWVPNYANDYGGWGVCRP